MMIKVVHSRCYGGFSLSREAILLARELSGNPKWGGPCIKGDQYDNGELVKYDYGYVPNMCRHDRILVQVVEVLGDKADGGCASLAIALVPVGEKYRIDEYDGMESVMTIDDYDWIIAE